MTRALALVASAVLVAGALAAGPALSQNQPGQPPPPAPGVEPHAVPGPLRRHEPPPPPPEMPAPPPAPEPQAAPAGPGATAGLEVLVAAARDAAAATGQQLSSGFGIPFLGVQVLGSVGLRVLRFGVPAGVAVQDLVALLALEPGVLRVQPNFAYETAGEASALQYAVAKIGARQAHRLATGRGVTVAVVDTAVDATHPALAGAVEVADGPFAAAEVLPHSHGTAVAAIIAARRSLLGVAPAAGILAIPAFRAVPRRPGAGASDTFTLLTALDLAIVRKVDVLNLSFTGPRDGLLAELVGRALAAGIVVVAAAGNGGPGADAAYPAALPDVLAVTATDRDDGLFADANRGSYIALAAPGVAILTAAPEGAFAVRSGTSLAAAHVSGAVALLRERVRAMPPAEVRAALEASAVDLGVPGRDPEFGAGRLDLSATLKAVTARAASGG